MRGVRTKTSLRLLPPGEERGEGTMTRRTVFACALFALTFLLAAAPAKKDSADLLVVNGRIVTMDEKFSLFDPGALAVKDGKILAVGPSAEVSGRYTARATYDAKRNIILPGLVNTHTHAAMTLLRGIADDLPLDRWLTEHIFPAEGKNVSPEFVYDGTLLAALETIEGGTTTFADMYYFESDAARAVEKAGLRAVLGETFIDFPVPAHKDLPSTLAFMREYVKRWKGHPRITPAAAPHSTYTCSKETLLAARDFALTEGIPILIHLRETKKELADSRNASPESPVLHLASIGFFDPSAHGLRVPIVAAHGVWMDEKDRALGRQYGRNGLAARGSRLGTRHRRCRRIQQRPEHVRGDGFRGQARQGLQGRPDGAARACPRRGGDARRGTGPRARAEDRFARAGQAGGLHHGGRPQRTHGALRGSLLGARLLGQGLRRDGRVGGRQAFAPASSADDSRGDGDTRKGPALARESDEIARAVEN